MGQLDGDTYRGVLVIDTNDLTLADHLEFFALNLDVNGELHHGAGSLIGDRFKINTRCADVTGQPSNTIEFNGQFRDKAIGRPMVFGLSRLFA